MCRVSIYYVYAQYCKKLFELKWFFGLICFDLIDLIVEVEVEVV